MQTILIMCTQIHTVYTAIICLRVKPHFASKVNANEYLQRRNTSASSSRTHAIVPRPKNSNFILSDFHPLPCHHSHYPITFQDTGPMPTVKISSMSCSPDLVFRYHAYRPSESSTKLIIPVLCSSSELIYLIKQSTKGKCVYFKTKTFSKDVSIRRASTSVRCPDVFWQPVWRPASHRPISSSPRQLEGA